MQRLLNLFGQLMLLAFIFAGTATASEGEHWDKDVGNPAPKLVAAGWVGTPVALDFIRGNTVLLAFWNADIAC